MQTTTRSRRLSAAAFVAVAAPTLCAVGPARASSDSNTSEFPATRPATPQRQVGPGLDREALQHDLGRVRGQGAVGVVGAVRGHHARWKGAAGVRSIDAARGARADDTFRVGSITKSMVATLALQQVQAERWSLHTTVGDVLPGLLPGHDDVTLEQLLAHRSGLPDYVSTLIAGVSTPEQLLSVVRRHYTDRQLVDAALTQSWSFAPGTDYSYSNTGYVVIGMMLERVTHHSIRHLLRARVFRPARMHHSSFPTHLPGFRRPHLTEYATFERPYNVDDTNPSVFSSAGAVVSTASDLDRFYRALFTGRLLRPDLVSTMATPRTLESGKPAYGLGIYRVGDPCPGPDGEQQYLYGHDGATFGTLSVTFTSADGQRQASIDYTGRNYQTVPPPTGKPANDFLVDAFSQTCPRAVPAPARKHSANQLRQALRDAPAPEAARPRP